VTDAQTRLERARDNETRGALQLQRGALDLAQAMGACGEAFHGEVYGVEHEKANGAWLLAGVAAVAGVSRIAARFEPRKTASWSPATSSSPKSTSPSRPPGKLIERTVDEGDP
jgi:hypothetical protein